MLTDVYFEDNFRKNLKEKAAKSGFQNELPKLPKKLTGSTKSGYVKRMDNWVRAFKVSQL